jgi:putative hydrolase of the HAD superfamily
MFAERLEILLGAASANVRAVLFDAVGTLLFPTTSIAEVYWETGRRHGSQLPLETISRGFGPVLRSTNTPDGRTDEAGEHTRWETVVRKLFTDVPATGDLFQELWNHFAQPSSWRLADGTAELLTTIAGEGFQVGVASNFDARLHTVLAGRLPNVPLLVSSELGAQKPSRGFFHAIERKFNQPPQRCLLIGDDWENDVQGSTSAGWQAIWLTDSAPRTENNHLVPQIRTLAELLRNPQ